MKNLTILGSTGSIGTNALTIVAKFPDRFKVQALTAKHNISKLARQIEAYKPRLAAVFDEAAAERLKKLLPKSLTIRIVYGQKGYQQAAEFENTDMVLTAMVGAAGLMPTIQAIEAGKDIALANKETLVMAGDLVMQLAKTQNVQIIPVDSEHNAIYQCLMGQRRSELDKLLITASGGPFIDKPADQLSQVSPEDALKHPNWQMGPKITIDSATLMNKGLEVIEAMHLFQVPMDQIQVVIHPQSIIHSMVAFQDGSILAQMGIPDMKTAIAFALSFPERLPLGQPLPNFAELGRFTFKQPDMQKFSCLKLAMASGRLGGTLPAVLNAANEIVVGAFLDGQVRFDRIPVMIEEIMSQHDHQKEPCLADILAADQWARRATQERIERQ
jgi:1-deoxy-D-xylulose-5-phosphate reductoisomerase